MRSSPVALPATADGALDEDAAQEVLDGLDRFRALVLGPGLGQAPPTVAAVRRLVAEAPVPLILDADGLNALGGDLDLLASRPAPTVVTPHAGEYARLAGEPVGEDRVAAARRLAERRRGRRAAQGQPDGGGRPRPAGPPSTLTGGPWLATAGTGDVLSGIVGALAALGVPAFRAAAAGAWLAWPRGRRNRRTCRSRGRRPHRRPAFRSRPTGAKIMKNSIVKKRPNRSKRPQ